MASKLQREKRKNRQEHQLQSAAQEIEKLVEQKVEATVAQRMEAIRVETVETFSGLTPHPEHCERYEALMPGFTDRVLKIAETSQSMTAATSRRRDWLNFISRALGQLFAVTVTLTFIGGGIFLFYHDKNGAAWGSMAVGLASVVTAFAAFYRSNKD